VRMPESVIAAAALAAQEHPDDVARATAEAERAVRELPEFPDLMAGLVTGAVRELVYDARHASNVRTRRQAGRYGTPAKVSPGGSPAVERVYESVYDYFIAGTTLGALRGEELQAVAEKEQGLAEGHLFNAGLCARLSKMVPPGQRVRDAVPERQLRGLFKKVQEESWAA
jgi:hypothetical protein